MLEQVVRPFVSPGSLATNRVVVARNTQPTSGDVTMIFGAVGTMPTPTVESTGSLSFKVKNCDNTNTEKQRQTSRVRVENPNDSSAYVIIERIDHITFAKKADDLKNDFAQAFKAFAQSIADAINQPFAEWGIADNCDEKFDLHNAS